MIATNRHRETNATNRIRHSPLSEGILDGQKSGVEKMLALLDGKKPGVLVIIEAIKLKIKMGEESKLDLDAIQKLDSAIRRHEPVEWLPPMYW